MPFETIKHTKTFQGSAYFSGGFDSINGIAYPEKTGGIFIDEIDFTCG